MTMIMDMEELLGLLQEGLEQISGITEIEAIRGGFEFYLISRNQEEAVRGACLGLFKSVKEKLGQKTKNIVMRYRNPNWSNYESTLREIEVEYDEKRSAERGKQDSKGQDKNL